MYPLQSSSMTDSPIASELATRIRNGDRTAEAELFSLFRNGIRQIIVKATGSFAIAEELTQETLIITLRRLRSVPLEEPGKLPAYIAQTARNLARAEMRKERRRRTDSGVEDLEDIPDMTVSHDKVIHLDTATEAVRTVLEELRPERDRHILVRHYLRDEDKGTICHEWGITESTFHVILFRARKRFLELLRKRGISRGDLFSIVLAL